MEYEEIIEIIQNKRRFGNQPGVVISKELLAAVGNPQKELSFVHIAGTNGKGSTAAFLCSILTEAGIKTGLFTSPHLVSFTERIRIGTEEIGKDDVVRLGEKLLNLPIDVHPTMFDYCFAMAMLYFKEQKTELVILETGLGGRLDSTNSIDAPLLGIITRIGLDHTDILGNTLSEIALEKAGILKTGTKAIIACQEEEAENALRSYCEKNNNPYRIIKKEEINGEKESFSYRGETYFMRMLGAYQKENAAAAILAAKELSVAELLKKRNLASKITDEAIHKGIENAFWAGRMELVCKEPFLLIDGAHNGNGVAALANGLRTLYPKEKFHLIMGVLADKDYEKMAEQMLPFALDVVTVTPESSRALLGESLAEYIKSRGVPARVEKDLEKALRERSGKTVAFGSLYFIGEIKRILNTDR